MSIRKITAIFMAAILFVLLAGACGGRPSRVWITARQYERVTFDALPQWDDEHHALRHREIFEGETIEIGNSIGNRISITILRLHAQYVEIAIHDAARDVVVRVPYCYDNAFPWHVDANLMFAIGFRIIE